MNWGEVASSGISRVWVMNDARLDGALLGSAIVRSMHDGLGTSPLKIAGVRLVGQACACPPLQHL